MSKFWENLNVEFRNSLVTNLRSKNKHLAIAQKNRTKSTIIFSIKILFYLISSIGLNTFCEGLSDKTIFTSSIDPGSLQFKISAIFSLSLFN